MGAQSDEGMAASSHGRLLSEIRDSFKVVVKKFNIPKDVWGPKLLWRDWTLQNFEEIPIPDSNPDSNRYLFNEEKAALLAKKIEVLAKITNVLQADTRNGLCTLLDEWKTRG